MSLHYRTPTSAHTAWSNLRRRQIAVVVLAALGMPMAAWAVPLPDPSPTPEPSPAPVPDPGPQPVEFAPSFLGAAGESYDLSRFERGNPVAPGDYSVDLYVNGTRITREHVTFRTPATGGEARPCFTRALLTTMGVNIAKLDAAGAALDSDCLDLPSLIPDARVSYDSGTLQLDVSVPQVAMDRRARGYVDPSLWQQGVNAFTLSYNLNAYDSEQDGLGSSTSLYAGLTAGLNLGGWRIRNQSGYNWTRDGDAHFDNIRTYAQHDVTALQSQLTLGDAFTSGEIFDSTGFRGVQMATDTRMLPDSMNGYAPVIRGTAETNARVEIRQSGYTVYETTVAPGAFQIDDLYATGYGGDLEVIVTEADGRQRSFTVPYAALPQLLRPGAWRYSATVGELRDVSLDDAPYFLEGTYQRGINNWLTGYTGLQLTDSGYKAALLGAAVSTPVGALSLDVTGAQARIHALDADQSGYSARVTYSKNIPGTGTNFSLAAYRYSSTGYLSLSDAARLDDSFSRAVLVGDDIQSAHAERSRLQLTLSQTLGERGGTLYASGSRHDYWEDIVPVESTYQVGWSKSFRDLSVGVSATRNRVTGDEYDNQYYLSLSMPLGRANTRSRPPQFSLGATHDRNGNNFQAGVTGTGGERQQFNYGVNGNFNNHNTDSVGVNAGWRAAYAALGASYTHGTGNRQASLTASGGMVVHPGGVTLAQQLGDTIGVVEARQAAGAHLLSDGATRIDRRGFAVANNLMPYRINDVMLDPKGISANVQLDTSRLQAVPRAGAVVPLKFETSFGRPIMIHGRTEEGSLLPFGAQVIDRAGKELGIVGQGGQVFVRYSGENGGQLTVSWARQGQCTLDLSAVSAGSTTDAGMQVVDAVCRGATRSPIARK